MRGSERECDGEENEKKKEGKNKWTAEKCIRSMSCKLHFE